MTDEELILQSVNCATMYFDGFGAIRKVNGVMRAIGYVIGSGAQLNIVVSLAGMEIANKESRRVLDEKVVKLVHVWGGMGLPH